MFFFHTCVPHDSYNSFKYIVYDEKIYIVIITGIHDDTDDT